jgi:hypothetical protein
MIVLNRTFAAYWKLACKGWFMNNRRIILIVLFVSGCAHVPLPEHLYFGDDKPLEAKLRDWQVLNYENFDRGRGGFVDYFVPPGRENRKSWTQLYTRGLIANPNISLERYVENSTRDYQARCPGTTHTPIESAAYRIYYLNTYPACKGNNTVQSEITLVIKGPEALYRVSYTVRGRELTESEQAEWLTLFRKAFVAKGDSHERVR